MIHEVLKTFVSESYAIYSEFLLLNDSNETIKVDSFGRISNFDSTKYKEYKNSLELIIEDETKVLKINLDNGIIFLVSKNVTADCSFFVSMFESLIPKLNISVNACINFEKLEQTNKFLEDQKKELIKANKTKDDFLANMSHELKTPLNSITVISSIMARNKDNLLNENQLKNMNIIKKCSDDLLGLINDILDISKIEAGVLVVKNEEFNLKYLLNDLLDSFEEVCIQKNIGLKREFVDSDLYINSDENKLSQIIKNLLSNAVKFTSKGYVKVKMNESSDSIQIEVIDTGIGIEEKNLTNIFDRFNQVDDSRTRKFGGTGLGLTISKELSNMLFCNLDVSSKFGEGTCFKLIIPKNISGKIFVKQDKVINNKIKKIDEICHLEKTILILCANSVEQFKYAIALKKENYKVVPFFDTEELYLKIGNFLHKNPIIIVDDKVENFNLIFDDYKEIVDFIVISDKKYENVILNLNEKDNFESHHHIFCY